MTSPTTATDLRSVLAGASTGWPPDIAAMNPPTSSFAGTLAQHAMAWHRPDWTEAQIAQDITRVGVTLIPAAAGAAILTLTGPGELAVSAAHGNLPDLTLPAQAAVGRTDTMSDLPSPHRWPIFTAPPGPGRTGTVMCTPLGSGHTMFGTLIIASDDGYDGYDADSASTITMLTVLAMHASNALAATRDRSNLHIALSSRDVIGQAKGILMERHRVTAETAFTELTRLSQINNSKLRDICEQLVATGAIPDPPARAVRTAPARHH